MDFMDSDSSENEDHEMGLAETQTETAGDKNYKKVLNNEDDLDKFHSPINTPDLAFKKSGRTRRSPVIVGSAARSDSKKRKLESSFENNINDTDELNIGKQDEVLANKVKAIMKSVNELKRLVDENPRTKSEIKTEVEKLGGYLKAVTEENLFSHFKRNSERKDEEQVQEAKEEVTHFPENIKYEEYKDMERKRWKEEHFTCTEIKAVNQKDLENSKNLMLILGQKDVGKQLVRRIVEKKTHNSDSLGRIQLMPGKPIVFKSKSCVITSNEIESTEEESKLCVLHMNYEDEDLGTPKEEELFNALKITSEMLTSGNGGESFQVNVATLCSIAIPSLRKLIESIFRYTKIKVYILTRATSSFADVTKKNSEFQSSKTGTTNTMKKNTNKVINIILQDEEKNKYKEIIKKMKEEINTEDVGVQVKYIQQTKSGNARIVFEEKTSHSQEDFKSKINECIGTAGKALEPRTKKKLIVKDLDDTTTIEEIECQIKKILNVHEDKIKRVTELRKTARGNNQIAIIEVEPEEAAILLKEGRIKVGWFLCRIEAHASPARCFNCNSYGHKTFQCKNETNNLCYKCSQDGHRAAECPNQAFCKECNKEGHQSGSMHCNVYRNLMNKEKREQNKRFSKSGMKSGMQSQRTISTSEEDYNRLSSWMVR